MDPAQYRVGPNGEQIPVYNNATPGFGGAILDAIRALAGAVAPKSITQRRGKINSAVDQAASDEQQQSPQTTDLGNQF